MLIWNDLKESFEKKQDTETVQFDPIGFEWMGSRFLYAWKNAPKETQRAVYSRHLRGGAAGGGKWDERL